MDAARETPDQSGRARRGDGARIAFDIFGKGDPPVVLLPSAPIIHARQWKGQAHFLANLFINDFVQGPP